MKMGLFKVDGVSLPVMYADSAAPTPDGVTVADHDMWRALDLVVRDPLDPHRPCPALPALRRACCATG